MVEMSDPFMRYRKLAGIFDIRVDGEEFRLQVSLPDKVEFIKVKEGVDKGRYGIEKLFEYVFNLFKKSYPNTEDEIINDLLNRHSSEVFDELYIGFGFITREKLKAAYAAQFNKAVGKEVTDETAKN
jgi:hypothetical protein